MGPLSQCVRIRIINVHTTAHQNYKRSTKALQFVCLHDDDEYAPRDDSYTFSNDAWWLVRLIRTHLAHNLKNLKYTLKMYLTVEKLFWRVMFSTNPLSTLKSFHRPVQWMQPSTPPVVLR